MKKIAGVSGYQQEEVDTVIGKMLVKKSEQKTEVFKAVPYGEVIEAFEKLDVNVGIRKKTGGLAMTKQRMGKGKPQ